MLKSSEHLNTLVQARERISDPNKWCKNNIYCSGRVCLVGALVNAQDMESSIVACDRLPPTLAAHIYETIIRMRNGSWRLSPDMPSGVAAQCLTSFNDRKQTTHADIIALLDECIATCD